MSNPAGELPDRLRKMRTQAAPAPWNEVAIAAVGGLVGVGFSPDDSKLLVASFAGRSVFELSTCERLSRDRNDRLDDWMSPNNSSALGIAPLPSKLVPLCGLWGGGLARYTADGWGLQVVAPDWPEERVVIEQPGTSLLSEKHSAGFVQIAQPITDLRAVGFNQSGSAFVIATSADLRLFGRQSPSLERHIDH